MKFCCRCRKELKVSEKELLDKLQQLRRKHGNPVLVEFETYIDNILHGELTTRKINSIIIEKLLGGETNG